jgi:diguanylate cyclase (GGDEF)-like protein
MQRHPAAPRSSTADANGGAATRLDTDDWDALFGAVRTRLRQALGDWADSAPAALEHTVADQARAASFQCADALDQLHDTLVAEARRCQRLELDAFDAQQALNQARIELQGTQAEARRASHLALHDSLTQLPNRSGFCQRLDQSLAQAPPHRPALTLLYLDLDEFKLVNDMHGHDIGDELLRIVASRLRGAVRADDVVGRLGGDEFACLLIGLPERAALDRVAHKLLDAVAAPVTVGKLTLWARASIGIALCPDDGDSAQTLLKAADAAMYRAKRQQAGHAFFGDPAGLRCVRAGAGELRTG